MRKNRFAFYFILFSSRIPQFTHQCELFQGSHVQKKVKENFLQIICVSKQKEKISHVDDLYTDRTNFRRQ